MNLKRLEVEHLEDRLSPSAAPFIVGVSPSSGSTTSSGVFTLSVKFSEDMNVAEVTNPANYVLINQEGTQIQVGGMDAGGHTLPLTYNNTTFTVTIPYNASTPLPADTYSLFVRGDQIFSNGNGDLPLSPPGQLVAVNPTVGVTPLNLNTIANPQNGLLGAATAYAVPASFGGFSTTPLAIAVADFNGDGLPDVAVVNFDFTSGGDRVSIFAGQADGRFASTPSVNLALPTTPKVAVISAMTTFHLTAFGGDLPSLALADVANNSVDVLQNSFAGTGGFAFKPATVFAASNGSDPVGVVAGQFDPNSNTDLALLQHVQDNNGNFQLEIFSGNGDGTFAKAFDQVVGTNTNPPTGVLLPTTIAVGSLSGSPLTDVVVGGLGNTQTGTGGTEVLINTTTPFEHSLGLYSFSASLLGSTTTAVTAVAIGKMDLLKGNDIVSVTSSGLVQVFSNDGVGGFTTAPSFAISDGLSGQVNQVRLGVLQSANAFSGLEDVVLESKSDNSLTVLDNTSTGTPKLAAPIRYDLLGNPVDLALADINGDGSLDAVAAAGSGFTVVLGKGDGTFLDSQSISPQGISSPNSSAVAFGDLNGDGIPDMVIADTANNAISIYFGTPGGGYTLGQTLSTLVQQPDGSFLGSGPVSIVLGDFGNTGHLDIAYAAQGGATFGVVGVLANLGNGTFVNLGQVFQTGRGPTQVLAGDFNHDGSLDLAVSHDSATSSGVSILLGHGNRTFDAPREFAIGVNASALGVADFNGDGNLDFVVADNVQNAVFLFLGDGSGNFTQSGAGSPVGANPVALAVADFNRDGLPDVVTVNGTTLSDQISCLINNAGSGFNKEISQTVLLGVALKSVAVTDLNLDGFPDLVVGLDSTFASTTVDNNLFSLVGGGDGTFRDLTPYQVGTTTAGNTTIVAQATDPLLLASTFTVGGNMISPNLILNGNFESRDLTNEQGNLAGWQTATLPDSRGRWQVAPGSESPLSQTTIPGPTGNFQAVLDESNPLPIGAGFNEISAVVNGQIVNVANVNWIAGLNSNQSPDLPPAIPPGLVPAYSGTNFLYQDVFVPQGASAALLSLDLFLVSGASFSDTNLNPVMDYRTQAANQQVRVDVVSTSTSPSETTLTGVLQNVFVTNPSTPLFDTVHIANVDLSRFAGQFLRLRIAAVNNQGPLVVGVDNVTLKTTFLDTSNPTISNLRLRNPGFFNPVTNLASTTDPTIIGQVGSLGTPANIVSLEVSPQNNGFGLPGNLRTATFDTLGNFSITLGTPQPGLNTVGILVVTKGGQRQVGTFSFIFQGPSTSSYQALGPDAINVTGQGVDFNSVSGRITSTVVDPSDPSGQTFYIGSANGGVWKTTDGGQDYTPLTDFLTNASGQPIPSPIGSLAISKTSPLVLYAGTGVADQGLDSRPGVGVLKTTNGGLTWSVAGNSSSVLLFARISKMVVDNNNPNIAYAAVASVPVTSGSTTTLLSGVYKTTDGGQTWVNVLTPQSMNLPAGTQQSAIASVTDLIIDPFNSDELTVGLGNIGLTTVPGTVTGVYRTANQGGTWLSLNGGDNPNVPNNKLPTGPTVGRITLAQGEGRTADIAFLYVLVSNTGSTPPITGGTVNFGTFNGLYASRDGGLNYTKVLLAEQVAPPPNVIHAYKAIDVYGTDGGYAGALVVDPADPYVVYVGGSRRYGNGGLTHGFLRVDTADMADANTYVVVSSTLAIKLTNDGDNATKESAAGLNNLKYPDPKSSPYGFQNGFTGEGVSWVDIEQQLISGAGFGGSFVPPTIHTLTFDPTGRLLVGTEGGLYRLDVTVNYDFTTGGFGILTLVPDFPSLPTDLTTKVSELNGNVQIASVTSVAIDPTTRGLFYTSSVGTGTSLSRSPLVWNSSEYIHTYQNTGATSPDAGTILVAQPDPTQAPGTPTTIYQEFAYSINAINITTGSRYFVPEVSIQGGLPGTYTQTANAGLSVNVTAGFFPVFAINPNKIFDSGHYEDELLLGLDRVYTSRTSAAQWDDLVGHPLSPGHNITAAAFAPSLADGFYVGTDDGQVFVDLHNGADHWPARDTGLPFSSGHGSPINGITVDPNNANIAYVMVGGFTNQHVFKTTNAGLNWTDITANLPPGAAYSMAVDDRTSTLFPMGKLFVGTDTGVYISADGGKSWQQLGVGLPHVPVIQLQFNPNFEELLVGTQGRGVFTLSTETAGPFVLPQVTFNGLSTPTATSGLEPHGPVGSTAGNPLTTATVTFNEPINTLTFTADANNSGLATVVSNVIGSNEYRNNLVNGFFTKYLHRPATQAELFFFVSELASMTDEQVQSQIVGSPEYFIAHGSNNNTWIQAAFQDILGHPADANTAAYFLDQLQFLGYSRQTVAFELLTTTEYRSNLAQSYYTGFLRRFGTPGEISAQVQNLANGLTDEQVISSLMASQEYYQKSGNITFLPGAKPSAIAYADLNKDGIPDLIVGDSANSQLLVFQGAPGGFYLTNPVVLPLPAGAAPAAIVTADFNHNGLPDIAVADSGNSTVTVFLNTSTPGHLSFNSGTNLAAGGQPDSLAVGNFDGNAAGNLGLAVVDGLPDSSGKFDLYVFSGDGAGNFSAPTVFQLQNLTQHLTGVAAGDLNGDGLPDLAISSQSGTEVLLNQSTPGSVNFAEQGLLLVSEIVTPAQTFKTFNTPTTSVAIGPVDTSGLNDVVATTTSGEGQVLVFQNQGGSTPVFSPTGASAFPVGNNPIAVTLRDLENRGINDIVVANAITNGTVTVLRNRTVKSTTGGPDAITFAAPVSFGVGLSPAGLAIADTNQDGLPDVATADSFSSDFWVTLGQAGNVLSGPSDPNFIGRVFQDLLHRTVDATGLNFFQPQLTSNSLVYLNGPGGAAVNPLSVSVVPGTNDQTFLLTFSPQIVEGPYTLALGVTANGTVIRDQVDVSGGKVVETPAQIGNPFNQNQDTVSGQFPQDLYTGMMDVNTSDNGNFLAGLYHTYLHRAADTTGFVFFQGPLDSARSLALQQVALQIIGSTEYRTNLVTSFITKYLHRSATQADYNFFVPELTVATDEQVIAMIVGSNEYYNLHGSTNVAWLQAVYPDLLGRPLDANGQNYFLGLLNGGTNRTTVAQLILNSTEYKTDLIQSYYVKFLGHSADANAISFFVPQLQNGTTDEQVISQIVSSGEYFLHRGNTNTEWLSAIYPDLLGRPLDAAGSAYYSAALTNGFAQARMNTALQIESSQEYEAMLVNSYYQNYLGHPVGPADLANYWYGQFAAGQTYEQIQSQILGSDEYFNLYGATNLQWLRQLYQQVLNRPLDQSGQDFFLNQLSAGKTRQAVALEILSTEEYQAIVVNAAYQNFLGHIAHQADITYWTGQLQAGLTTKAFYASLTESVEFYNIPQIFP